MELITLDLFAENDLASCFTKTSQVSYQQKITHLDASWPDLLAQTLPFNPVQTATNGPLLVMLPARKDKSRGALLTLNITECHNGAAVSSLSQVLETTSIPAKYFLSAKACAGILNRASKRGKALPPTLKAALEAQAKESA